MLPFCHIHSILVVERIKNVLKLSTLLKITILMIAWHTTIYSYIHIFGCLLQVVNDDWVLEVFGQFHGTVECLAFRFEASHKLKSYENGAFDSGCKPLLPACVHMFSSALNYSLRLIFLVDIVGDVTTLGTFPKFSSFTRHLRLQCDVFSVLFLFMKPMKFWIALLGS